MAAVLLNSEIPSHATGFLDFIRFLWVFFIFKGCFMGSRKNIVNLDVPKKILYNELQGPRTFENITRTIEPTWIRY